MQSKDEEYQGQVEINAKAFLATFATENGELVLKYMKNLFFHTKTTHVKGFPDISAFNEGKRDALNEILQLMEMARHPEIIKEKYKNKEPSDVFEN